MVASLCSSCANSTGALLMSRDACQIYGITKGTSPSNYSIRAGCSTFNSSSTATRHLQAATLVGATSCPLTFLIVYSVQLSAFALLPLRVQGRLIFVSISDALRTKIFSQFFYVCFVQRFATVLPSSFYFLLFIS